MQLLGGGIRCWDGALFALEAGGITEACTIRKIDKSADSCKWVA